MDLEIAFIDYVLVVALDNFGLDFFLNLVLSSLLFGHLVFLLLLFGLFKRDIFGSILGVFFLGEG